MGFDKAKVVRAAEKYLAQGKIAAAIIEYRNIVAHDENDYAALNTLGDLYIRTKQKDEAIGCFRHVAEHYRQQGFTLKAIAMYKKIDRLQPQDPEIAGNLALLYEAQGLLVDARAQYMVVADAYGRDGQQRKALEVLRRIADLDSQNTEIRLQLAQGYMRENMTAEAAKTFAEAGRQFLTRGIHDRALSAFDLALDISPRDPVVLSGMLEAHIKLGTADEAAEIISRAVAEQPDDVELLSMLVTAHVEAEDAPAAEHATALLVKQDAAMYERFVDVARIYINQNDLSAAVRVLGNISEQMLAKREEARLMELLNEVLTRDPEQIPALHLLIRIHTWQRDDDKLRAALERLAEAAEAAGLVDEERRALVQLIHLSPEQDYLDRLHSLGAAAAEEEKEQPAPPQDEGVPTFESFALVNEDFRSADAMGLPATEESTEFEWNAVTPTASEPTAKPPTAFKADPSSSFADLNEEISWVSAGPTDTTPASESNQNSSYITGFQEIEFNTETLGTQTEAQEEQAEGALDPQREAHLKQELDSVDFYIAQGYTDIALDTLGMLERQFGPQAGITARREKLTQDAPIVIDSAPPVQEYSAEFTDARLYEVAEETIAADDVEELDSAFAELTAPTAPVKTEEQPPPDSSQAKPAGIDPGLAAIFDEFRTAVEDDSPASDDGDYETHYNLGIAYKEMDLVDEAVEEFQAAAALAAPQDSTPRYLQCCNMLGHCFMQKGMPSLAVMWFKKGLETRGHTEDEYQALRYDLGLAYEQMGELDRAIEVFTEVYGVNVSYRGVAGKLRELQAQKAVTGNK
ncbi:MAG TPA: tetratricopeptide repeat protein [Pyrinomonadaceae bacterium]|jgi:tetratricopeptide (TPR) repeat protein